MDYLFFDTEVGKSFADKGNICEFGYVLTDENFVIIKQNELVMNPDCAFDWYALKNILTYKKEEYKAAPKFPAFYEEIKSLLSRPDTLVVGHTTARDVNCVRYECERYHLGGIEFDYADLKEGYKRIYERKEGTGLSKMAAELGIEENENEHNAHADAVMTMKVAKTLSANLSQKPEEFCTVYKERPTAKK